MGTEEGDHAVRTLDELESEVRFLGATLLTDEERSAVLSAWVSLNGFVLERVTVASLGDRTLLGERTLIRMPDYQVRRGSA